MFYLLQFIQQHYPRHFLTIFLSVMSTSLIFPSHARANSIAIPKTIAITQIVGHASLDKVRQGIIDELNKNGYQNNKTARIVFENAQGNVVVATQIAQQFVALHPDVIVAIATPSAQAVTHAAKKTNIPIVFATITDPIQAKLVTNLKHPGGKMTGTRNVSPIDKQLLLIKKILPPVKTIGIVLNYGEPNSVQLLQSVIENAKHFNIKVKSAAASTSAEVQSATNSLMGQIDALLLLQDNTVASALPAVLKVAQKQKTPVFAIYLEAVQSGALAGLTFYEYAILQQT